MVWGPDNFEWALWSLLSTVELDWYLPENFINASSNTGTLFLHRLEEVHSEPMWQVWVWRICEHYESCNIFQYDHFDGGLVLTWRGTSIEGCADLYKINDGTMTVISIWMKSLEPLLGSLLVWRFLFLLVYSPCMTKILESLNNVQSHVARDAGGSWRITELIALTGLHSRLT